MAPFSSPAAASSSISSPVVLVSIMPRAEPAALSHHPMKTKPARASESALRRWAFVCDVVAQMLLLPMVCVSVCGAVGLLLGLECMEKLQSRGLPFQRAPQQQRCASHERTSTRDCIAGANANRDQREKEEGRRDDDAGARRPLKKQRSSATSGASSSTSTSSDLFVTSGNTSSNSSSPLETRPLVHKVSAKHKKQITRSRRVFIWDLDETLVLFASLYTGEFAQTHGKEIAAGVQLGEQMMTFMLAMLERHFFFNDLHDADIDHIHCLRNEAAAANEASADGPGPSPLVGVAARYERIREIYEREGAVDFLSDERSEWFAIREALVAAIDVFSTGWLQEARQVLELLTSSSSKAKAPTATSAAPSNTVPVNCGETAVEYENINLMVTNTQLAPALCKCLIYQLDAFFPIESVYSSSKLHKQHCFEQILRTYSSEGDTSVEFIAIGDGAEEEHVSRALGIQFHKIRSLADLKRLRFDLQLEGRSDVRRAGST